jgi:hypothetical protein
VTPSPSPPLPDAGVPPRLHLRIVKVRPSLRRGRLIVWGRCDAPCRIGGRARFGVIGPSRHFRATASRSLGRRGFANSRQRLALKVPPRLLRLARSEAPRMRSAAVRVALSGRDRQGNRASPPSRPSAPLSRRSSPVGETVRALPRTV